MAGLGKDGNVYGGLPHEGSTSEDLTFWGNVVGGESDFILD